MGHDWQTCPLGELRNPMWLAAIQLSHLAEIAPLSGWPDTWSAGIADALIVFRQARAQWQAEQAAEAVRQ